MEPEYTSHSPEGLEFSSAGEQQQQQQQQQQDYITESTPTCILCDQSFEARYMVAAHFKQCAIENGNPDKLRYEDHPSWKSSTSRKTEFNRNHPSFDLSSLDKIQRFQLKRYDDSRPFTCILCDHKTTRRDSIRKHFNSCEKKMGNPNGYDWYAHPSCFPGRRGLLKGYVKNLTRENEDLKEENERLKAQIFQQDGADMMNMSSGFEGFQDNQGFQGATEDAPDGQTAASLIALPLSAEQQDCFRRLHALNDIASGAMHSFVMRNTTEAADGMRLLFCVTRDYVNQLQDYDAVDAINGILSEATH
ncbi:MAG: hypothetical protein M1827_006602 [Pycnora praestabilis]|nr:MAG: hypothetical protein M1827_006602 [Pycnora praestabilis]